MEYNINGYGKESLKRQKEPVSHKISIIGRKESVITGVTDVNEFDNSIISLNTIMGRLMIKGRELKVKALDLEKGEVEIEGNIDNIYYTSRKSDESFLKKMFK